jgi:hypothetical protein
MHPLQTRKDARTIISGGLAWVLPVTIVVMLAVSGIAGYFLYKVLTYRDAQADGNVAQGKEGIPTIEENLASINRPVFWDVDLQGLPEGSVVYVDGEVHNERPLVLDGMESPFTFRVEAEGYVTWEQDVEVHSDLTLALKMLTYEEAAELAAKAAKKRGKAKDDIVTTSGPTTVDFADGGLDGSGDGMKKMGKGKLKKTHKRPELKHLPGFSD